jgi:hypothetical protein
MEHLMVMLMGWHWVHDCQLGHQMVLKKGRNFHWGWQMGWHLGHLKEMHLVCWMGWHWDWHLAC